MSARVRPDDVARARDAFVVAARDIFAVPRVLLRTAVRAGVVVAVRAAVVRGATVGVVVVRADTPDAVRVVVVALGVPRDASGVATLRVVVPRVAVVDFDVPADVPRVMADVSGVDDFWRLDCVAPVVMRRTAARTASAVSSARAVPNAGSARHTAKSSLIPFILYNEC